MQGDDRCSSLLRPSREENGGSSSVRDAVSSALSDFLGRLEPTTVERKTQFKVHPSPHQGDPPTPPQPEVLRPHAVLERVIRMTDKLATRTTNGTGNRHAVVGALAEQFFVMALRGEAAHPTRWYPSLLLDRNDVPVDGKSCIVFNTDDSKASQMDGLTTFVGWLFEYRDGKGASTGQARILSVVRDLGQRDLSLTQDTGIDDWCVLNESMPAVSTDMT